MREQILQFLTAVDLALAVEPEAKDGLDLHLIGRAALILFYGSDRGVATRDLDVVQFSHPADPALRRALELFGKDTAAPATYGLYLESVASALPPMAAGYRQRSQPFRLEVWQVMTVHRLEIHDLAISKLKRFAAKDRADLRELADKELLQPTTLQERLEAAFIWTTEKDGDDARDGAFEHLGLLIAYIEGKSATL